MLDYFYLHKRVRGCGTTRDTARPQQRQQLTSQADRPLRWPPGPPPPAGCVTLGASLYLPEPMLLCPQGGGENSACSEASGRTEGGMCGSV